jgi:hypothetical protein
VAIPKFNAVLELTLIVTVLEPKSTDLVEELAEEKLVEVIEKFPLLKDPSFTLIADVEVNALPSVQPPPMPPNVSPAMLTPLVVIVLPVVVALNVVAKPDVQIVPATNVIEPLIVRGADIIESVTVLAETVRSRHRPPVIVTV